MDGNRITTKETCAVIAVAAIVSAWTACAAGDIIFDNGGPNPATGGVLSDLDAANRVGDDFVLQLNANAITGLQWWGFYPVAATTTDNFTIEIYELVAGLPAVSPLFALNVGAVTRQEIDPLVYVYETTIAPLELTAGQDYVLSIFNASAAGFEDDWSWYTSGEGSGFGWLDMEPPMVIGRDFAFVLSGPVIPTPGAIMLFGLATVARGSRRRR